MSQLSSKVSASLKHLIRTYKSSIAVFYLKTDNYKVAMFSLLAGNFCFLFCDVSNTFSIRVGLNEQFFCSEGKEIFYIKVNKTIYKTTSFCLFQMFLDQSITNLLVFHSFTCVNHTILLSLISLLIFCFLILTN